MNIKTSKEFKKAIKKLVDGDGDLVIDIARYIHTSLKNNENEKIYKLFEIKQPKLFLAVELWVNYLKE